MLLAAPVKTVPPIPPGPPAPPVPPVAPPLLLLPGPTTLTAPPVLAAPPVLPVAVLPPVRARERVSSTIAPPEVEVAVMEELLMFAVVEAIRSISVSFNVLDDEADDDALPVSIYPPAPALPPAPPSPPVALPLLKSPAPVTVTSPPPPPAPPVLPVATLPPVSAVEELVLVMEPELSTTTVNELLLIFAKVTDANANAPISAAKNTIHASLCMDIEPKN